MYRSYDSESVFVVKMEHNVFPRFLTSIFIQKLVINES